MLGLRLWLLFINCVYAGGSEEHSGTAEKNRIVYHLLPAVREGIFIQALSRPDVTGIIPVCGHRKTYKTCPCGNEELYMFLLNQVATEKLVILVCDQNDQLVINSVKQEKVKEGEIFFNPQGVI